MSETDLTLKALPVVARVVVLMFDRGGEPWPVTSVDIDAAGRVDLRGDASKAYATLLTATRKCGMRLASQSVREALRECAGWRDDLEGEKGPEPGEPEPEQAGGAVTQAEEGRAGVPASPFGGDGDAGGGGGVVRRGFGRNYQPMD